MMTLDEITRLERRKDYLASRAHRLGFVAGDRVILSAEYRYGPPIPGVVLERRRQWAVVRWRNGLESECHPVALEHAPPRLAPNRHERRRKGHGRHGPDPIARLEWAIDNDAEWAGALAIDLYRRGLLRPKTGLMLERPTPLLVRMGRVEGDAFADYPESKGLAQRLSDAMKARRKTGTMHISEMAEWDPEKVRGLKNHLAPIVEGCTTATTTPLRSLISDLFRVCEHALSRARAEDFAVAAVPRMAFAFTVCSLPELKGPVADLVQWVAETGRGFGSDFTYAVPAAELADRLTLCREWLEARP